MKHLGKLLYFVIIMVSSSVFLAGWATAGSLGVDPLFMELSPGKSGAIRIQNAGEKLATVEVLVFERVVDENGIQTRREADDDFIIFPPQAVIRPSSTQVIRFQPVSKDVGHSKSYFVTIKEIPIKLNDVPEGFHLNVVFAFDSAVHIVPRGVKEDPQAISAKPDVMWISRSDDAVIGNDGQVVKDEISVPAVSIEIENQGSKYFYIQDYNYIVTGINNAGHDITIDGWTSAEIVKHVPVVLVEPGKRRAFSLPLPIGTTAKDLTVSIKKR
ncbi:MAG: molecular chaperone [Pyrinomonadaceae bacterium]|nr:molecular chaperone [Pyrinomonadaceae bacterium]